MQFDTKYGLGGDSEHPSSEDTSARDFPENFNVSTNLDEDGINLSLPRSGSSGVYRMVEEEAAGFATHITLEDPRAVLVVRNVRNRLVITLPQVCIAAKQFYEHPYLLMRKIYH